MKIQITRLNIDLCVRGRKPGHMHLEWKVVFFYIFFLIFGRGTDIPVLDFL